jgi:hypothetical protein
MTSHGEAKLYPENPEVILLVQQQMIPWAHEISTQHLDIFAVHGGVEFLTFMLESTSCIPWNTHYSELILTVNVIL